MKINKNKILVEPTGFPEGDELGAYVAYCYVEGGGVCHDYGDTEAVARERLVEKLETAPPVVCATCQGRGYVVYGPGDRKMDCPDCGE